MNTRAALLAITLLAGATAVLAQPVYRCGPGRNVYSDTPCRGGQEVKVSDARSDEQREASQAVTRSTQEQASQLEQARRETEVSEKPAQQLTVPATLPPRTHEQDIDAVAADDKRRLRAQPERKFRPLRPLDTAAAKERLRKNRTGTR